MKKKLYLSLLALPLVLSGCIISFSGSKPAAPPDGGFYVSVDKGETWQQKTSIYQLGGNVASFNNEDVTVMTVDPEDNQTIYVGTVASGIFFTYSSGDGWYQTLNGNGKINAIAVNPKDSCTLYAAIGNRVYKSTDCSRHWSYKLIDARPDPNNIINALAVDPFNPSTIYAGSSGTSLYRSDDGAESWRAVKQFNNNIVKILANPKKDGVIYVATQSSGIFRTQNRGADDWPQMISQDVSSAYQNMLNYQDLKLDPTTDDGLLYVNGYGLFRSPDGGRNWQNLKLLTPPNSVTVYTAAINPTNEKEIYYFADKTFYRSEDGGINWVTKSLPSTRSPLYLYLNTSSANILYLGVFKTQS